MKHVYSMMKLTLVDDTIIQANVAK